MFSEALKVSDGRLTAEGDSLGWAWQTRQRQTAEASARPPRTETSPCLCTDSVVLVSSFISLSAVVFFHVSPHAFCGVCTDLISQLSFSALRDLIRMTVSQSPGKISPSLFFSPSLCKLTLSVTNSQWHLSSCCVSTESLVIHTSACKTPFLLLPISSFTPSQFNLVFMQT